MIWFALLVVLIGVIGFMYLGKGKTKLTDTVFSEPIPYVCAKDKSFNASFAEGAARVDLDDGRTFTLEQVSINEEEGAKFVSGGDQIVLWAKDSSAFIEENGAPAYSSCRDTLVYQ